MGRIHLLDDAVINKIAAGEVVERPASVVKELVENAIDAGATKIRVSLELGGTKAIVITDNGMGMDHEDLLKSVTRHATSKIQNENDLFEISSMGFRGEALASISAVSKVTISTHPKDSDEGYKLSIVSQNGVDKKDVLPWTGPTGTTVAVNELFYNVPVRLKFLKASSTEYSHCVETYQAIALANPHCSFSLVHNEREIWSYPAVEPSDSPETVFRQRCGQVFGASKVEELIFVEEDSRYGKIKGLVSPPGLEKGSGKFIYTFLNGRLVKDTTLRYGIMRGYHSHLLKGRYPFAVLFIEMDPALVDVNVHPAKTEVRLQYPKEIQNQIALGIREVIRKGAWAGEQVGAFTSQAPSPDAPAFIPPSSSSYRRSETSSPAHMSYNTTSGFSAVSRPSSTFGQSATSSTSSRTMTSFDRNPNASHPERQYGPITDAHGIDQLLGDEFGSEQSHSQEDSKTIPWHDLEYIGAFAKCYLFFSTPDGRMLVLDQHAFHERVLFERLVNDETLLNQVQKMLMPEEIVLTGEQIESLILQKPDLAKRGFSFEQISDTSIEVSALPAILMGKNLDRLFSELAEPESATESTESNATMSRLILATIACHAAVRAGEELGTNELRILMNEAPTVDFYHVCPHGRRVFKWWNKRQIESWFDR